MSSSLTVRSFKDLTKELEKQLKQLTLIQDEIGFSTDCKQEKQSQLFSSVIDFVHTQINQVIDEKQDIIKQTEACQKAILSYKKWMGEYASNTAVLDPSKSLQDNLQELQNEHAKVEQRYNKRLVHVKELYVQLQGFKESMGNFVNMSMLMQDQIDVSSLAVNALEEEIQRCETEYINRKESVEDGVKQISNLLVILGLKPESNQDILIDQYYREQIPSKRMKLCNALVPEETMRYIAERINELEELRQQVEFRKEEITQNLKHLWSRLHIDSQECEEFLMTNRGLTEREIQTYENELEKLLTLKKERIGDFIQTAREELETLWNQLYYSKDQKRKFESVFTNDLSDASLEAHENEISKLQLDLEDSKSILELVEKHMKLKQEVADFEAMTSDPNRLFGKGQRDPGRLLREEKFRKRISRELPKVTKELEGHLLEYEALKGHPFLVYEKPYFDIIYEQEEVQEKPVVKSNTDKFNAVVNTPRTPKRERDMPFRKPVTSPRAVKPRTMYFNTPQVNRAKSLSDHLKELAAVTSKSDNSESILHSVREKNMKNSYKQKVIRRENLFDDDDDDDEEEEDENTRPAIAHKLKRAASNNRKRSQIPLTRAEFESDDNCGLDLGIFDDGPELSDMSDVEA